MIESFLVYSILMVSMASFTYSANQSLKLKSQKGQSLAFGFIAITILIFGIVFGARWDVGIDHQSYLMIYEQYGKGNEVRDSLEPGFVFINRLLSNIGLHYFFYFFLFASLQISFLLLALQKRKEIAPFVIIILMTGQFLGWMNIMRQETVVCIFIWLIMTIEKRNFVNYLFWIILSALFFHKSAVILIPFYQIIKSRKSLTGPIKFQVIIYLLCLYLGYIHYILSMLDGFGELALLIGYEQYGDINNAEVFFKEDFNWGARSWINTVICLFSIMLSARIKHSLDDKAYVSLYNFFFWGSCCALICTGVDVISRVFTYFSGMSLIVYGYTLYYVYSVRKIDRLNYLIFLLYSFLNFLVFAGTLYAATQSDGYANFQFFWQI